MQVVNHDGYSYWVPAEKEGRINGIRKWDQAFCIYAAIYSKHNPTKSAEIWQYIHVINTAAGSYAWENVCYYDLTFRRLMHEKLSHSWAKTYTQLWNLAMCDPINKSNNSSQSNISGGWSTSNQNGSRNDWRGHCCWCFNRGDKCKKWNCHFDHRCSGCSSWSHALINCPKSNYSSRDDFQDGKHKKSSRSPSHRYSYENHSKGGNANSNNSKKHKH